MEDETKKKKFPFLASLGAEEKVESPAPDMMTEEEKKKKNVFYVGNASDAIQSRKTLLGSIK